MTGVIAAPEIVLGPLGPALVTAGAGALVLLVDLVLPRSPRGPLGLVALAGVTGALVAVVAGRGGPAEAFGGMVVRDDVARTAQLAIGYAAALALLVAMDSLPRLGVETAEAYALVLLATTGMFLLAASGDLVVLFLALELVSLSLYALAGLFKGRPTGGEAALKYFVLGVLASAFLLYGIALLYGAAGSTSLARVAAAAAAGETRPLVLGGLGLVLVGLGFKISAVPFHMWAPDVYEGAPAGVAALIATGSKAAALTALVRVVLAVDARSAGLVPLLWTLAALTMTVGNLAALGQASIKRLLAYSSVAHVGYLLVGLTAGGPDGVGAILFYLLAYTFTTAGAFAVVALARRGGEEAAAVNDYAGLARRHPGLALVLTVFLLSLIGIPPLAGFVGKVYLFGAAIRAGHVGLAVLAVLNSAVAAYYYLRVIVQMYMREPEGQAAREVAGLTVEWTPSPAGAVALTVALAGVVLLGVVPGPLAELALAAVLPLVR